jgi:hypothetical protein
MDRLDSTRVERDSRFPSGRWTGFYAQRLRPGRHTMTIDLTFRDGELEAQGSDEIGPFTFDGSYDASTGKCEWTKQYLGKHRVTYTGVNEGQGIWGVWEINMLWGMLRDRGVFHIWPKGMTPSSDADLTERAFAGEPDKPRVILGAIGIVLLVALYFLFRYWLVPLIMRLLR